MAKTNGTTPATETPAPAGSLLTQVHQEWLDAGKPVPTKKEFTELERAYAEARKTKAAAEKAYNAAAKAESDSVAAIVRACGKGKLKVGGEIVTPMARGESLFMRRESTTEVRDFKS